MADDSKQSQPMLLSEQLLHCTVRIQTVDAGGTSHVGTAFFFSFLKEKDGNHVPALVTCKHVVKGARQGTFHLTVKGTNSLPEVGKHIPITLDKFESRWMPHPDPTIDLCMMPIAPLLAEAKKKGKDFFYITLDKSLFLSEADLNDVGPLQRIVLIGYPIGIWDSKNNLPIARQGVLATDPSVDYEGRKEFMIDAACFPGSSGSPVMLFNQGSYPTRSGISMGSRLKFLGVMYAAPQYTTEGKIIIKNIPTKLEPRTQNMIPANLGLVLKSTLLNDFEKPLKKLIGKNK